MDNRAVTTGIITIEAIANAADADHPAGFVEVGTAGEALGRLFDPDHAPFARRESSTAGGHTTEAIQSL